MFLLQSVTGRQTIEPDPEDKDDDMFGVGGKGVIDAVDLLLYSGKPTRPNAEPLGCKGNQHERMELCV